MSATTLVLGPSLGTTAADCWGPTVDVLRAAAPDLDIRVFDLPGHGAERGRVPAGVSIASLARQVLDDTEDLEGGAFVYAGDSVGGQVGLQLLLDAPDRVLGAVLCCTGARIGDAQTWTDRVAAVRADGTAGLVEATRARWFAPGFAERHPDREAALLEALADTDDDGYIAVCGAIAGFDVGDRLGEITRPVVAVGGADDAVCPPDSLARIADGVQQGRLVILDDVAHQAPAEAPEQVAAAILALVERVGQRVAQRVAQRVGEGD